MSNSAIVMYARERFCPDVKRSRDRLAELGLPWTEHDIEADADATTAVEELTGQRKVPTLVIGDTVLIEPSNRELDDALQGAGFDVT